MAFLLKCPVFLRFSSKAPQRSATLPAHEIRCTQCDLLQVIGELQPGQQASCVRCGHHLIRIHRYPFDASLAYALAALILLTLSYETGRLASDVRGLIKTLDSFAQQPQVQHLPAELQQTLTKLQGTLNTLGSTLDNYSGQSPAYGELNRALGNLNQILQEARPVIRTLNEKPNALLFDRTQEDLQPKGAKSP